MHFTQNLGICFCGPCNYAIFLFTEINCQLIVCHTSNTLNCRVIGCMEYSVLVCTKMFLFKRLVKCLLNEIFGVNSGMILTVAKKSKLEY